MADFTIQTILDDLNREKDIYKLPTANQLYIDDKQSFKDLRGDTLGKMIGGYYGTVTDGMDLREPSSGAPQDTGYVNEQVEVQDNGITGVADVEVLEKYPELKGKLYKSNADTRLDILANASQEKNNLLATSQIKSDPTKLEERKTQAKEDIDAFVKKYQSTPTRDLDEIKNFYDQSEKDLDVLYKEDDLSFEKKLALAKFGLDLAGGTSWNGRALPILSEAGQSLIENLGAINAQKKANSREKRLASATLKREKGLSLIDAKQQNAAEAKTIEWDVLKTGLTVASEYDTMINTNDVNDRKIFNEGVQKQINENFEIFKTYTADKYPDSEVGVTQFISKESGQVTMPRIGLQNSKGEVFIAADLNIHPGLVDTNGQPLMVNADVYADMSIDGGGISFSSGGMMPGGEGLKGSPNNLNKLLETASSLNSTAAVLNGLALMRGDISEDGTRVGWAGGARSVFQESWRNATNVWQMISGNVKKGSSQNKNDSNFWNGGEERYYVTDLLPAGEGSEDFSTITSEDENGNPITTSILSAEQQKGLLDATNQGTIMMREDYDLYMAAKAAGEKTVLLGGAGSIKDRTIPVSDLDTIFTKDFYDPAIPAMQVRAQSLIYALARSRKSSGRLNKDDIERASLTLNLYGKSDRGIDASLEVVQVELQTFLRDEISNLKLGFFNDQDKTGRNPFVAWTKEWIDKGNYLPGYLEDWATEFLPESYSKKAKFRAFDNTDIMTSESFETYSSGMDITGSVVEKGTP